MKAPIQQAVLAFLAGLVLTLSPAIQAHPITYKDGFAIMTWNQPFLNDLWMTYTFRPDMAIAARGMRMEMEDGENNWVYLPQLDYLVKRWNGDAYQANIYVYGGVGGERTSDKNGIAGEKNGVAGLTGIEADAESLRWYAMAKGEALFTSQGRDVYSTFARLGIAPYKAEIDQLATWIMVQGQFHPALSSEWAVTPLVRLFYRNVLLEGGASIKGEWMANFMFHF